MSALDFTVWWPYPAPRHAPDPDPLVRDDFYREIGALPPERRTTDLLTRTEPEDRS